MGATYSIFEDIPPGISILNNQKQPIDMEARVIVFYLNNTDHNERDSRLYARYKNLIAKFKHRGFIVLTVIRNLEKILTDPQNGIIGAILNKIRTIRDTLTKRNITIDIPSLTFLSIGESCVDLLRVFNSVNYIKSNQALYQKIVSDQRTATTSQVTELKSKITSIILINPTYREIRTLSKTIRVKREVRVIYTAEHELDVNSKKTSLPIIQKITEQMIADRIQDVKQTDLVLNFRRNLSEKTRKSQAVETLVDQVVSSIYEAIGRET